MTSERRTVRIGDHVAFDKKAWRVSRFMTVSSVLAVNLETGLPERLHIRDIQPIEVLARSEADGEQAPSRRDIEDYSQEEWAEAQRRLVIIEPLISDPNRTRATVDSAAHAAGHHPATLYQWMRLYLGNQHLSSLVPAKRGRSKGHRRLDREVEKLVEVTIGDQFLRRQKGTPQNVIDEVARRCHRAGLPMPHPNTIRNRLRELNADMVLRRRGRRDLARSLYTPIRGEFPGATFPLAVVQIDHSPANVMVVEELTRLAMGRPWITLAIEVFSRMVFGWYISMEHPNAAAAGLCLVRGMLPKDQILSELGVPGEWPVHGLPRMVHADNAREFKGETLRRACEDKKIELALRPVKTPHYGGHIERLMGTVAGEVCKLPGATFASPEERKGYDSEARAAMTLDEFEAYLVDWIVNQYHREVHSGIGVPPLLQWESGILGEGDKPGIGLPWVPDDPERLRLDFMPWHLRTVQPYGIVIDDIHYYHEVLNRWINAVDPGDSRRKRKFTVRYDPRDLSRVHFYDPDANRYFEIPYRDPRRPSVSVWELREARRQLRERGARAVDEDALFDTIDRLRNRAAAAVAKTKAARRQVHRRNRNQQHSKHVSDRQAAEGSTPPLGRSATTVPDPSVSPAELSDGSDLFSSPVEPFNDRGRLE